MVISNQQMDFRINRMVDTYFTEYCFTNFKPKLANCLLGFLYRHCKDGKHIEAKQPTQTEYSE